MSNQIENYRRLIDNANDSLTEHLASWHAFALKGRELPVVSYLITGEIRERLGMGTIKDNLSWELTSDLSKLSEDDTETVKTILAQHHGMQALEALTLIEKTAGQFKAHLTSTSPEEETNEDIPEADYPETNHDNDEFE